MTLATSIFQILSHQVRMMITDSSTMYLILTKMT